MSTPGAVSLERGSAGSGVTGGTQRVAVVTGASRGIGKAAALALADAGFVTIATGRESQDLEDVGHQLLERDGRCAAVPCDVGVESDVQRLFGWVMDQRGRIDVLFNNAGVSGPRKPIEEVSMSEWTAVVATNLTGAFLCLREAFARMKDQRPQGGRIINNGSLSAHVPRPESIAYTATKHAITGLTRSASLDGRRYGIACGQIDIGNAATDLTRRMTTGALQADGSSRVEPTIDVAEVARAIVYMASLPADVNVQFMTVMARDMPFIGRG